MICDELWNSVERAIVTAILGVPTPLLTWLEHAGQPDPDGPRFTRMDCDGSDPDCPVCLGREWMAMTEERVYDCSYPETVRHP